MRLSRHTDYALRVLIHLAAAPERLSSIAEIARAYGISENHLMKVVNNLARSGVLRTVRGRGGGIALARPAKDIMIGTIVRQSEPDLNLAECGNCVIAPACGLISPLDEALRAFLAVLDNYSVADAALRKRDLTRLLGLPPSA
jgi:Rrf2 family nitric oxide-sensitive transcriptional repressor